MSRHIRVSRLAAPFAVALALVVLVSASGQSARAGQGCWSRGTTIVANAEARVYRIGGAGYRAYVCAARTGETRRLGFFDEYTRGRYNFAIAGRYVAYIRLVCEARGEGCRGGVRVLNVRTGRIKRIDEGGYTIAVTPRGAVAWTQIAPSPNNEISWAIVKVDADGRSVLDGGDDLDPFSLASVRDRVYWTNAGVARSAVLK